MGALETLFADLEADRLAAILLVQAYLESGLSILSIVPPPFLERAVRHLHALQDERKAAERDPKR